MVFSFGRGTYYLDCGSTIKNTSIDMGGNVIINHGSPVNPTDSVNKAYVDSIISGGSPVITVSLTSTNYTLISSITKGVVKIYVKNVILNGPSAIFELCKSESDQNPGSYNRTGSSSGVTSSEELELRWDPGSGIELKKNGANYDGNYSVKVEYI